MCICGCYFHWLQMRSRSRLVFIYWRATYLGLLDVLGIRSIFCAMSDGS